MTVCEEHIHFTDPNCEDCKKEWAEQTKHLTPEERFPFQDWQYDVANGDTRLGYADWLAHHLESETV